MNFNYVSFFCYALFIEPTPRFLCQGIQKSFISQILTALRTKKKKSFSFAFY